MSKAFTLEERLRKRAYEFRRCAENSRVVENALSEQIERFHNNSPHNVYAVRLALDHRDSAASDYKTADDLEEAANILEGRTPSPSALMEALRAAKGYMLNALIDLKTGTKKQTTINTLEGGIARIDAVLEGK